MTDPDQTALDSALMLAKQKFQEAQDKMADYQGSYAAWEDLENEAKSTLSSLGNGLGRLVRSINRDLEAWYESAFGHPNDRPRYDVPPRLEWGGAESSLSGFAAAFRYDTDAASVYMQIRFVSHRYRLILYRKIMTTSYDEIMRTIETLAEAGKSALSTMLTMGAPTNLKGD